jgi:hypothetical protein
MENKRQRPVLIAVIQYFLLFLALTNALSLFSNGLSFLNRIQNEQSITVLLSWILSLIGMVLFVITASQIAGRTKYARGLAIASFALLSVRGVLILVWLFERPDLDYGLVGKSSTVFVTSGQIVLYLGVAAYLIFSPNVIYYFHPDREPVISDPPPPPSFDN